VQLLMLAVRAALHLPAATAAAAGVTAAVVMAQTDVLAAVVQVTALNTAAVAAAVL
jgi:hypothetical protein